MNPAMFRSVAFRFDSSPRSSKNAMVVGRSWLGFTPAATRRDPRYRRRWAARVKSKMRSAATLDKADWSQSRGKR